MEMNYNGKYYLLDNLADRFGDFIFNGTWICDDEGIYHVTDDEGKDYELCETFRNGILHYDGLGESLIRLDKAYGQIEEKTATLVTILDGSKPWKEWKYDYVDPCLLDKELTGGNAYDTNLLVSDMANFAEELTEGVDELIQEIEEDCRNGKVVGHIEEGNGFNTIVGDIVQGKLHKYIRGWGGANTIFQVEDKNNIGWYAGSEGIRVIE